MREILLTSSVLILALLILRRAFREKISRRVQYALWALVLVRLLTPVSLPAADLSVLSLAEPVRAAVSARLEAPAFPAAGLTSRPSGGLPRGEAPAVPGRSPGGGSRRGLCKGVDFDRDPGRGLAGRSGRNGPVDGVVQPGLRFKAAQTPDGYGNSRL